MNGNRKEEYILCNVLSECYKSFHHPKVWYGICCVLLNSPNKKEPFFLSLTTWENDMKMIPFIWNSTWGTGFKVSLGRRTKIKPLGYGPGCCDFVMCTTFIGVSSDQRKNGAAQVGMHTLTLVNISSRPPVSSLFQLRWQTLFIARLSSVITKIYLSLYPYLHPKLITDPLHFQPLFAWASVIPACINPPTHDRLANQAYL